ncbi:MAG: hypothetical protein IPM84_22165 [Anaerolineae bacterium]|nr:hypothetical protein [Anaerolineae bacterium]
MKRPNISVLLLDVTFGIVFAFFNFDGFLRYAAHHWLSSSWLAETIVRISWWPQRFLASLNASHLSLFHDLLVLCFYGVWVCLGFIALLSLIRLNLRITFSGLLGLTTGAASIGILAWLGVLLVVLGGVLMAVLRFLLRIWNFLVGILGAVWTFIVRILTAIWGFLLPIINFLLPILLIVAVIALVVWGMIVLVRRFGYGGVVIALLAAIAGYFLRDILLVLGQWLWSALLFVLGIFGSILNWLGWLIGTIVGWIFHVLIPKILIPVGFVLLIVGAVLIVVGTLGSMLLDQFRAAWHSGTGQKGILLGAFSVGLSLALILWVCLGSGEASRSVDQAWSETSLVANSISPMHIFAGILPVAVRNASIAMFGGNSAPNFDAMILALILPISYFGVLRGLTMRTTDEFRASFIHQDVLVVGGALALAIPAILLVMFAASVPREES